MFKVEKKRHPVPAPKHGSKYPWADMKVGQSFLVPNGDYHKISVAAIVTSRRKAPMKWVARVVTNGVRVWRVA
jgi:hypothetical protein